MEAKMSWVSATASGATRRTRVARPLVRYSPSMKKATAAAPEKTGTCACR